MDMNLVGDIAYNVVMATATAATFALFVISVALPNKPKVQRVRAHRDPNYSKR